MLKLNLSLEKREEKMLYKITTKRFVYYIWDFIVKCVVCLLSKKFTSNLRELLRLYRTLEIKTRGSQRFVGQIQSTICFYKSSLFGSQQHIFCAAFMLQAWSWVVVTETMWPAEPKRFALWPFTEEVCWLLVYTEHHSDFIRKESEAQKRKWFAQTHSWLAERVGGSSVSIVLFLFLDIPFFLHLNNKSSLWRSDLEEPRTCPMCSSALPSKYPRASCQSWLLTSWFSMHVRSKEWPGLIPDLNFVPLAFGSPCVCLENHAMGLLSSLPCEPPGTSSLKEQRVELHKSGYMWKERENAGWGGLPPGTKDTGPSPREEGLQREKNEN